MTRPEAQTHRKHDAPSRLHARRREWAPVALAALLLVLLAVLAAMQHRWLGRASEADLQRTSASLQAAASRFGTDFNRELSDLLGELVPVLFRGLESGEVTAAVQRWRERAAWPELAADVWEIYRTDDGVVVARAEDQGDPGVPGEIVAATEPPPEIERLAAELAERFARAGERGADGVGPGRGRNPFFDHPRVLMAEVPAVVLPRPGAFHRGPHRGARHLRRPPGDESADEPAVWVIRLDAEVIRTHVLPELARRHFSAEEELGLRVVDADGRVVWSSDAESETQSAATPGPPVAAAELFGPLEMRPDPGPDPGLRAGPGPGPRRGPRGLYAPVHDVLAAAAGIDRGQWRLEVTHPAGSLDAAVASARRRSLLLSFLILSVLGGSILLLAHGARRAQALARRQLEFVAGVTHELRTPVAALRSAGQNLAHGVVKPERVKTYGELVDREGRRLEESVDQILAFAGLSSAAGSRGLERRGFEPRRLAPRAEVRRALEDLAAFLREREVHVELTMESQSDDELPEVEADPEALGRALRNLIQNAALHGRRAESGAGWVGVEVDARGGLVHFHVRDRGPGVDPADEGRIFEPFVRGRGLAASNVPGSGLGLALVRQVAEAHGGQVTLAQDDQFTTFTLSLPAAGPAP